MGLQAHRQACPNALIEGNHLAEREPVSLLDVDACFNARVCVCLCSISFPHGFMVWSLISDCGISCFLEYET